MIAHRCGIVGRGMPTAPAQQPSHDAQPGEFAEPLSKRDTDLQDVLQAPIDIDLALDIGATQSRAIAGQEKAHQPRRQELDRDPRLASEVEDFPVPKGDAQWQAGIRKALAEPSHKLASEGHLRSRLLIMLARNYINFGLPTLRGA